MADAPTLSTVLALWRYPVKSLGGEQLQTAEIGPLGIVGDRSTGLLDVATGNILTARRAPALLFASARSVDGEVVVTLPDGIETADDEVLSRWLARDIRLVQAADLPDGGTYEAPLDAEAEADWVSWTGPAGAFHDSKRSRVSIVGADTLGPWPFERFRTNVVVAGSGEDRWVGTRVGLGTAEIDVRKQIDRCVMVTRPQPGLERDLEVLRTVNRERSGLLAVGALVAAPGTVSVGDPLIGLGVTPAAPADGSDR